MKMVLISLDLPRHLSNKMLKLTKSIVNGVNLASRSFGHQNGPNKKYRASHLIPNAPSLGSQNLHQMYTMGHSKTVLKIVLIDLALQG